MSPLLRLLTDSVKETSRHDEVALLLSGGVDSVSSGVALHCAGKRVHAYTYEVEGIRSLDRPKAERIARHFGWPTQIVRITVANVRRDFALLAIECGCKKKVHFENTFALLYLFAAIEEAEVWSGWNADDHYGNTYKELLYYAELQRSGMIPSELKEAFDRRRLAKYERFDTTRDDTWWYAVKLAESCGKKVCDPYVDPRLRRYFLQFDHASLSPSKKPLVRAALVEHLRGLPENAFATGVKLQKGGGISRLFEQLLADPVINRFQPRYCSVSALCQRWAREVAAESAAADDLRAIAIAQGGRS